MPHFQSPVRAVTLLLLGLSLVSCEQAADSPKQAQKPATQASVASTATQSDAATTECTNNDPDRMALFGDLHVHTSFSFDAAAISTGATPVDAHRYARGEPIPFFPINEAGEATGTAQIDRPLDFLAVTDHGEFLGERAICTTEGSPSYATEFCENYRAGQRQGMMMLATAITTETPQRIAEICGEDGKLCQEYAKSPWQRVQQAANEAYSPCEFTSFVAYEYTGTPGTSNYHRNVIFKTENVPDAPVSFIDAPIDSQLWEQLDQVCIGDENCEYLTIPHNSNLANGRMAPYMRLENTTEAKQAYARARLQREPIMEIFQHKGGSECINGLSTVFGAPDELCSVEAVRHLGEEKTFVTRNLEGGALDVGQATETTVECQPGETGSNGMLGAGCVHPTDFQRSALIVGLKEEQDIGLNPIKLGVIAATDTHSATPGNVIESAWTGAVSVESTPAERLQPGLLTSGIDGNPGGLAAVWATENTREAIFAAMLRREVFGTSGPRIKIRLFAGWDLDENLCASDNMVSAAYAQGVPMGGDLVATESSDKPRFLAIASKDPDGANLNAMQLIKGWVDAAGKMHSAVIPIAAAEDGAAQLCQVFTDDDFDAAQSAYYYLRALEPETPRWHTYDCATFDAAEQPAVCTDGSYPATVREMAWSSPIWYKGAE